MNDILILSTCAVQYDSHMNHMWLFKYKDLSIY